MVWLFICLMISWVFLLALWMVFLVFQYAVFALGKSKKLSVWERKRYMAAPLPPEEKESEKRGVIPPGFFVLVRPHSDGCVETRRIPTTRKPKTKKIIK